MAFFTRYGKPITPLPRTVKHSWSVRFLTPGHLRTAERGATISRCRYRPVFCSLISAWSRAELPFKPSRCAGLRISGLHHTSMPALEPDHSRVFQWIHYFQYTIPRGADNISTVVSSIPVSKAIIGMCQPSFASLLCIIPSALSFPVSWLVVMTTVTKERRGHRRKETRTSDRDAMIFNSSARFLCNAGWAMALSDRTNISKYEDKRGAVRSFCYSQGLFYFPFSCKAITIINNLI